VREHGRRKRCQTFSSRFTTLSTQEKSEKYHALGVRRSQWDRFSMQQKKTFYLFFGKIGFSLGIGISHTRISPLSLSHTHVITMDLCECLGLHPKNHRCVQANLRRRWWSKNSDEQQQKSFFCIRASFSL
jgi:hypothetical protein